jgi:hypothetical protein
MGNIYEPRFECRTLEPLTLGQSACYYVEYEGLWVLQAEGHSQSHLAPAAATSTVDDDFIKAPTDSVLAAAPSVGELPKRLTDSSTQRGVSGWLGLSTSLQSISPRAGYGEQVARLHSPSSQPYATRRL